MFLIVIFILFNLFYWLIASLCLIIAESYAHLNNTTEALKYLNLLRSKRITQNYIAYTMDNLPEVFKQTITTDATGAPLSKLISAILCERRKELWAEV